MLDDWTGVIALAPFHVGQCVGQGSGWVAGGARGNDHVVAAGEPEVTVLGRFDLPTTFLGDGLDFSTPPDF